MFSEKYFINILIYLLSIWGFCISLQDNNIYRLVRFKDEIVDSFHGCDKAYLLRKFRLYTTESIDQGISLISNLNSFQQTDNQYKLEWDLIETSLESMQMDLNTEVSNQDYYEKYILCFAEVP